jgi:hypothetical protein
MKRLFHYKAGRIQTRLSKDHTYLIEQKEQEKEC